MDCNSKEATGFAQGHMPNPRPTYRSGATNEMLKLNNVPTARYRPERLVEESYIIQYVRHIQHI